MSDLAGRCFVRRGSALLPADIHAEEFLREIGDGREVIVSVRKPRNPQHHRWFFAMLRKVCDNSEQWASEEALLDDLKMAAGHRETCVNGITGEITVKAKSINFASMDEFAFRRFVKRCGYIIAQSLGIDVETLMAETDREAA